MKRVVSCGFLVVGSRKPVPGCGFWIVGDGSVANRSHLGALVPLKADSEARSLLWLPTTQIPQPTTGLAPRRTHEGRRAGPAA